MRSKANLLQIQIKKKNNIQKTHKNLKKSQIQKIQKSQIQKTHKNLQKSQLRKKKLFLLLAII